MHRCFKHRAHRHSQHRLLRSAECLVYMPRVKYHSGSAQLVQHTSWRAVSGWKGSRNAAWNTAPAGLPGHAAFKLPASSGMRPCDRAHALLRPPPSQLLCSSSGLESGQVGRPRTSMQRRPPRLQTCPARAPAQQDTGCCFLCLRTARPCPPPQQTDAPTSIPDQGTCPAKSHGLGFSSGYPSSLGVKLRNSVARLVWDSGLNAACVSAVAEHNISGVFKQPYFVYHPILGSRCVRSP